MLRLLTFGASTPSWDGEWTVVMFTVPEDQRDTRRALRDGLRLLHFGMLFDAVWVSPTTGPPMWWRCSAGWGFPG